MSTFLFRFKRDFFDKSQVVYDGRGVVKTALTPTGGCKLDFRPPPFITNVIFSCRLIQYYHLYIPYKIPNRDVYQIKPRNKRFFKSYFTVHAGKPIPTEIFFLDISSTE